ncbi:MAG: hypothetical protein V7607_5726 [Solirubrobacteraceae bacterium]
MAGSAPRDQRHVTRAVVVPSRAERRSRFVTAASLRAIPGPDVGRQVALETVHAQTGRSPRGGSVLVAFDADDDVGGVLHVGAVLARERRARLRVVGVSRALVAEWCCPPGTGIIPWSVLTLGERMTAHAQRNCREMVRSVGADVPVDHCVRCGRPDQIVDSVLATGDFVAVVVHGPWTSTRRMRRAARRWRDTGIAVHAAWG